MPQKHPFTATEGLTLLLAPEHVKHLSIAQATASGASFCSDPKIFDPSGQYVISDFAPLPAGNLLPSSAQYDGLATGTFLALVDLTHAISNVSIDPDFIGVKGDGKIEQQPADVQLALHQIILSISAQFTHAELRYLGYQINQPGLIATTVNQATDTFIGMHVDSWDKVELTKRRHSRNRICINIGCETRRLMFVPLTLAQIEVEMGDAFGAAIPLGPTGIVRQYLSSPGDHRVIGLDIPPLHAYIAPTENIGHDATTRDTSTPDKALTIIGNFLPSETCSLATWKLFWSANC
jgi:hypothetical protein